MKTGRELLRQLESIDRRGYPAYKALRGVWRLDGFDLSIDHLQGDPFAAPSKLSVWVPAERAASEGRCAIEGEQAENAQTDCRGACGPVRTEL